MLACTIGEIGEVISTQIRDVKRFDRDDGLDLLEML
jgi:hypothetical protein